MTGGEAPHRGGHRHAAPLILVITSAGAALGLIAASWTAGDPQLRSSAPTAGTANSGSRLLGKATFPRLSASYTAAVRGGSVVFGLITPAGGPVSIMIIPPNGSRIAPPQINVELRINSHRQTPRITPCGLWCYRFAAPVLRGSKASITIQRRSSGARAQLALPAHLPPAATALYAKALHYMTTTSVAAVQALSSGVGRAVVTRYAMQAPDRTEFSTSTGQQGVLIGDHRWALHNGTWTKCPSTPQHDPTYAWQGALDPRSDGPKRERTGRFEPIHLFNPTVPAWFTLRVASDGRAADVHMIAPSHFMHETYQLDPTLHIRPPKPSTSGTC